MPHQQTENDEGYIQSLLPPCKEDFSINFQVKIIAIRDKISATKKLNSGVQAPVFFGF
jgi:hypothetical protein